MSLISRWFSSTLAFATDSQNTPEIDLRDSFEAIEIDIPTIEAAEIQIKGSNATGGTFDLIALEEPVPSSTGGFRTTVPLGGKYQYIKVFLSAAQSSDRIFAVRGVSYASAGLVALIDRIKQLVVGTVLATGAAVIGKVRLVTATGDEITDDTADAVKSRLLDATGTDVIGAVTASPTSNTVLDRLKALLTGIILATGSAIIGRVGHDSTGIGDGVETVDSAGTDQAIVTSSTPAKRVNVQAQTDNTSAVAVGASGVDAVVATGTGMLLYAGDWTGWMNVDDLADVFIDALVTGEGVRFIYET